MWFQLQLNAFLPPLSILIGDGGFMYVKLVDIGLLLQKSNPYSYRNVMKHLAVQGKDILPSLEKVSPKTLNTHVVPITMGYKLIYSENIQIGQLFLKQLREGTARKQRMKKYATQERKAPLLVCVDDADETCVSVPLWIEQFIKDLELYRQEVRKHHPSTSRETLKRNCQFSLQEQLKRSRMDNRVPETFPESMSQGDTTESVPPAENTESVPPAENAEPMSQAENAESMSQGDTTEPMSQSDTTESLPSTEPTESVSQPVPNDIPDSPLNIKEEPMSDPTVHVRIKEEPMSEPTVEPIPGPSSEHPVEPTPEPSSTSSQEPSTASRVPQFFVNLNNVSFQRTSGLFPGPGDLIVKFHTPPSRVYFVLGEEDAMYWVSSQRNE